MKNIILSTVAVLIAVAISFAIFPFASRYLPDYKNSTYEIDFPSTDTLQQSSAPLFPLESLINESGIPINTNSDELKSSVEKALSMLGYITPISKINLDGSLKTDSQGKYIFAEKIDVNCGNTEYYLRFVFEADTNELVYFECDEKKYQGVGIDKDALLSAYEKIADAVKPFTTGVKYTVFESNGTPSFLGQSELPQESLPFWEYITKVFTITNQYDLLPNPLICSVTQSVFENKLAITFSTDSFELVIIYNPVTQSMVGFSLST